MRALSFRAAFRDLIRRFHLKLNVNHEFVILLGKPEVGATLVRTNGTSGGKLQPPRSPRPATPRGGPGAPRRAPPRRVRRSAAGTT